jgi:hypothetical protein
LKKKRKPILKQLDVQLLVEWKEGIIVEGETKKQFISWESRSLCCTLWRKKGVTNKFLLKVVTNKEVEYRKASGKHFLEERSLSPIEILSPRSTLDPKDKNLDALETEEEKDIEEE